MTDEQIIKALECCYIHSDCTGCPCEGSEVDCLVGVGKSAIDLINRQKAEIENCRERLGHYIMLFNDSYKKRQELSAEAKRLQKHLSLAEECIIEIEDALHRGSPNGWAEDVIKEYNNLAKEMEESE